MAKRICLSSILPGTFVAGRGVWHMLGMNKPTSERKGQKIACISITEKIAEILGALKC